jgi:hypothetical protein
MGLEDVDPGDETHRYGDYVYLSHDEQAGGTSAPEEGDAVSLDGSGNLKQAEQGDDVVGVLYTYPYYGDSSGSGPQIDQNQPATVKVQGSVKARVDPGVTPGDALGAPDEAAEAEKGELGLASDTNGSDQGFRALSGTVTEDGQEYADVLLR